MRISDWSSDVCSSDLVLLRHFQRARRKLPELGLQRLSLLLQCDELVLIGLFPLLARRLQRRRLGSRLLPFQHRLLKARLEFRNPLAPALLDINVFQRVAKLLEALIPLRTKRRHPLPTPQPAADRKSNRLNSSH